MNFKVTRVNQTSKTVRISKSSNLKVTGVSGGPKVPARFGDLEDFDKSNLEDNFVIVYDQATKSYKTVDPDVLLSKSVIDDSLPDIFIEEISEQLGEDIDAGNF